MVEHPLIAQWVTGSIPYGGPIELFPIPASAQYAILWDHAYTGSLADNQKE